MVHSPAPLNSASATSLRRSTTPVLNGSTVQLSRYWVDVSLTGDILEQSDDFRKLFGFNEVTTKDVKISDLVPIAHEQTVSGMLRLLTCQNGLLGPFPTRIKHPQGYWVHTNLTFERKSNAQQVRIYLKNKNKKRSRLRARLRQARDLQTLFENNLEGLFCLELERPLTEGWTAEKQAEHVLRHARIVCCNNSLKQIFQWNELADPQLFGDLIQSDAYVNKVWLQELLATQQPVWHNSKTKVTPARDKELTLNIKVKKEYRAGLLWRMWFCVQDVTLLETYERLSQKTQAHYKLLTDNLEHAIFMKDGDLRYVAANKKYCDNLGLKEEDIIGRTDYELHPAELAERYRADDREVIHHGDRIQTEQPVVFGNGQTRITKVVKTPVRDEYGKLGVLGIYWDITEEQQLQEQRRHAQKVDALSKLAGHVANDFNNMLTAIMGNSELLKVQVGNHPENLRTIQNIERAAQRATDLTSRIMSLSRPPMVDLRPLDLNLVVENWLRSQTLPSNVKLHYTPNISGWLINADTKQLSLVIKNLVENAVEAMPEGGELSLSVENKTISEQNNGMFAFRNGDYICLVVKDNGTGIQPEFLDRLYDPFFSSRSEPARGLGLALVRQAVEQHHGWIKTESTPGKGTTFRIWLPRYSKPMQKYDEPTVNKGKEEKRNLILLVEDEEILRHLSQKFLQNLGFEVLLAETGQMALEIYQTRWQDIGAVVLDLSLPGMSGLETLDHLQAKNPEVRVLLTSGFAAPAVAPNVKANICGFLAKPFRLDQLAKLMQQVLQQ